MAKFLVLYRSPASAREQMGSASPEDAKAGIDAWMAWAGRAGDAIVDLGAPLDAPQSLPDGASGGGNAATGFSILQGDSSDAVLDLLREHPHLQTPGGSI